ncbi:protein of unknown function [Methylocella tundrae]|uniref:Uncharacterized protein n=1 Tax=Methylocella tundrae TaxID=227605 RepID=A0A4V6IMP7_METTU|nr:protein of unknown function [Methylocella tundrae]
MRRSCRASLFLFHRVRLSARRSLMIGLIKPQPDVASQRWNTTWRAVKHREKYPGQIAGLSQSFCEERLLTA